MTVTRRPPLAPRLIASGWDYLVILGWLAALGLAFLAGLRPFAPLAGAPMPAYDLLIAALTVVPVWGYLVVTEAGRAQASWGKRRARLVVTTSAGARPGTGRIMARNAVKLLPWQLAHLGMARLWYGTSDLGFGGVALVLCYALAGGTLALLLARRDRAALHDLVAGTRVTARP